MKEPDCTTVSPDSKSNSTANKGVNTGSSRASVISEGRLRDITVLPLQLQMIFRKN